MTGERGQRVRAELAELARSARSAVDGAVQRCAVAARRADETTAELGALWTRRVHVMRQRPGAGRADWRNDQLTDP